MFAPLCCGCCYFCCWCFQKTSHLFSILPTEWRNNNKKNTKNKNFFDYFLWALSCCFRWMAELSFHKTTTTTAQTQHQQKLYNFLYLCIFFSFWKIKELIMEVFKSRTKLFCLFYLALAKKGFSFDFKITWLQINQLKFNSDFLCLCVLERKQ